MDSSQIKLYYEFQIKPCLKEKYAMEKTTDLIPEYEDSPENPPYMIIKVNHYWLNRRGWNRYETTRSSWKASLSRAQKHPYVLSVTNGIVEAVYKVTEWHKVSWGSGRIEFTGEEAEPEVANLFLHKRIPEKYRKKGASYPVLYCKR